MFRTAVRITSPTTIFSKLFRRFNSSKVVEITSLKHFQTVIGNKSKLSIVDFYATWCGPCKAIAPVFEKLAEKIPEVDFARVDVDQAGDVAQEYAVNAMPTFIMFQDGEKVEAIVGADLRKIFKGIQKYGGVDLVEKGLIKP